MAWFPFSANAVRGFMTAAIVASLVASPAIAGKADNSVRFASDQTVPSVDPYFNNQLLGVSLADTIWDSLIFHDPATGTYKGNLATAWRWIDDRTLELDLREGVQFHNGAPFDADDVVYTVNFVADPNNKAVAVSYTRWIERAEKLNRYRVRLITKQPFPAAIAYLASPRFVIHPRRYYEAVGPRGMNARPVGTGPFRVVEHALGKHIRLERNPNYFRDGPKSQPRIDKLEIRFVADGQTRVAEVVAGGLDLIMSVAPDQADQLREIAALKVVSGETMRYAFLQMNANAGSPAPQLRDVRVRQAIMHAIDRETMVRYLVGESARVLHTDCHPDHFGCTDADVPRYEYNPDKARRLLREAGFPNGFDIDLHAFRYRNQTEAIIGYLGAVGIRARLRFMEYGAVLSATRAGRVSLVHNGWATVVSDASASVSVFHEFAADDTSRDPEVRDLLVRADTAMDPDVRRSTYAKALTLIQECAYVLPLYSLPNYYLSARDLMFKPYTDEMPRFWEMYYQ